MNRSLLFRKTLYIVIIYGLYYNLVFLWLRPSIYSNLFFLTYLIIQYTTGSIDTYLRPLETERREQGAYLFYILMLIFIAPFLFILADIEHTWLFGDYWDWMGVVGLVVYLLASIIILWSRQHLGKQGTGVLVVVEDHHLITSGLYSSVRHPMYFGILLGVFGFCLVVQSVIVAPLTLILYAMIFNQRANYEEVMLIDAFGEEYAVYKESTKKFLPYLY